jgi:hypothetical protein
LVCPDAFKLNALSWDRTVPINRGELTVSYRWTDWVWEILTGWSSRLQGNELSVVLEEFRREYHASIQ